MTAKQFTVIDHNEWSEGDIIYYDNGEEMGWMDVCDKLNELHEENTMLKERITDWETSFDKCKYEKDNLTEENKKLKSEINMLKTVIARNEAYINRITHKGEWKGCSE